ncbi:MAG: ATP-binding protein [Chloroflexota bacterium]
MNEILGSLALPLAILFLVGALFVIVQMTAALRVGETAAVGRLKRWAHLPEAILRLSAAPNIGAAVQGMTLALGEALGARGSLALVRLLGGGPQAGRLEVAAASGTLHGQSDKKMLEAALSAAEVSRLAGGQGREDVIKVRAGKLGKDFGRAFPGGRRGWMVVVRLRLVGDDAADQATAIILLHVAAKRRLDRFNTRALEVAVQQFPRVVQAVTARFAQAEVMEQLLEEARIKDDLLRMLLGSYQHDLGNTLASLQTTLLRAWEEREVSDGPVADMDADFAEMYRTIQLVASVARSGERLVDIAEGKVPAMIVEPQSPAEIFDQVVRPFLSLRSRRRPELKVETDLPADLPLIYIDRVAFFRALSNVLHNAFKFTREGSVRVRAYRDGDLVTFEVSDTGPGIPPGELPSIGQFRFRGSGSTDQAGQGIGLWVTRQLTEAMGGSFRVESQVGEGSALRLGFAASPTRLDSAKIQVRSEL